MRYIQRTSGKDDSLLTVDDANLPQVLALKDDKGKALYQEVPAPEPVMTPQEVTQAVVRQGLIEMTRGGEVCYCELSQVDQMKEAKWRCAEEGEAEEGKAEENKRGKTADLGNVNGNGSNKK